MKTIFHWCNFYLQEDGWGKPIFIVSNEGPIIFYPEKAAEPEDFEPEVGYEWEGASPTPNPRCGAPMYVGSVVKPSWN